MTYRIRKTESVEGSVRKIAQEQIDKATREIEEKQVDSHEAVHHFGNVSHLFVCCSITNGTKEGIGFFRQDLPFYLQ